MHTKDTVRSLESDVGFAIIRILGILIDNAIDETATLKLKSFRVLLLPARDHLEIVVANPIPDGFDLTRLNQKGFTTKGSGHGQGMSIINDLIQQNPNISMRKAIINNDQLKITLFIGGKAHA
nr:GHKL domain-containing protein [Lacticaseibacillus rhamnosus]